jgi:hypothetical protein
MPKPPTGKVSVSFRISKAAALRWAAFCRDYSGKPLFIRPGELGEKALMAEIDRQELILSGAIPNDRIKGADNGAPAWSRRKPLNAAT